MCFRGYVLRIKFSGTTVPLFTFIYKRWSQTKHHTWLHRTWVLYPHNDSELDELREKIKACFDSAAIATGCTVGKCIKIYLYQHLCHREAKYVIVTNF